MGRLIADQRRKNPTYRGLFHCATSILKEEGVTGLYRGVGPTIMKQGSNQAIRFFVMESLRNKYTNGKMSQNVPYYMTALFGSIAGGASVLGNTPIDVIKTRMQSGKFSSSVDSIKVVFQDSTESALRLHWRLPSLTLFRACSRKCGQPSRVINIQISTTEIIEALPVEYIEDLLRFTYY